MKKTVCIITALVLVLLSVFSVCAAESRESFVGVTVNMPYIRAELKGSDYASVAPEDITASLGGEKLSVESIHRYNPSEDTAKIYMLVDTSPSIKDFMPEIKEYIKEFASRMGSGDSLELIKFSTKVETVLDGSESIEEINKAVDAIECSGNDTALYDALHKTYQKAITTKKDFTRSYAIVFTDCENYNFVGVSESEILDEYKTHNLPLYVAAPEYAYDEDVDKFEKITRSSGGEIGIVSSVEEFNSFTDKIDDVSIIDLTADDNIATGEEKNLSLSFGENAFNMDVSVSNSVPDEIAPKVKSAEYDLKNNRFIINFSESVTNTSNPGSYTVVDKDNKKWTVSSVEAPTDGSTVQLIMEDALINGVYTVTFNGVTDCSLQKNPVESPATIEVTGVEPEAEDNSLLWIITAGIISAVIIAAVVVAVILSARKSTADEEGSVDSGVPAGGYSVENEYYPGDSRVKHHIKMPEETRVKIRIKTGNTSEQTIETGITGSIIVGRSSACDIYIDDAKLSRQHFVIESKGGELYISDLNSKNGTFINGVKIGSRRKILNGDKIFAGLSEIYILII